MGAPEVVEGGHGREAVRQGQVGPLPEGPEVQKAPFRGKTRPHPGHPSPRRGPRQKGQARRGRSQEGAPSPGGPGKGGLGASAVPTEDGGVHHGDHGQGAFLEATHGEDRVDLPGL